MILEGWWEEVDFLDVPEHVFCLGIVSLEHEDENLVPLDGCWHRESLPKLAALAAELGVRVKDSENGQFIE